MGFVGAVAGTYLTTARLAAANCTWAKYCSAASGGAILLGASAFAGAARHTHRAGDMHCGSRGQQGVRLQLLC